MGEINITSHNQQGGITAREVNVGTDPGSGGDPPSWMKWVVAISTVIGVIAAIAFGIIQLI